MLPVAVNCDSERKPTDLSETGNPDIGAENRPRRVQGGTIFLPSEAELEFCRPHGLEQFATLPQQRIGKFRSEQRPRCEQLSRGDCAIT